MRKQPNLNFETSTGRYGFWFAFYFIASHTAVVFFTQPGDLRSLGRYFFGTPVFFAVWAFMMSWIKENKARWFQMIFLSLSVISLVYWWVMYGNTAWLG